MYFKGINSYGDRGMLLDFGDDSSKSISIEVNKAFSTISNLGLPLLNIIPSFNKIVIIFENSEIRDQNKEKITYEMNEIKPQSHKSTNKTWKIPACYDESFALDLKLIQQLHQITKEEIINLHTSESYYTYYIGFMPGFPYLGDIPSQLITPRLATPRIKIPARSIGIAKNHTCIYPKISPGGWNIIGQIPFDIFDLQNPNPSLFLPGDKVSFYSVSNKEFQQIQKKHFSINELIKEYSS
ncbi:5-oxoprolinase subunit PxpB [Alphaproteobacteria bacterium]|nr:5-oxoprolinase subunit PxpB [Alphaproteobacteria bacterium]